MIVSTPLGETPKAVRFHETYERLAPPFGYATREDTKVFDPETPNGKLMAAVCRELLPPGWAIVPERIPLDEEACGLLLSQMTVGGEGEEVCPFTLFVGDAVMVHGLHFFDPECPEEGVITLAKFPNPQAAP